MSKILFGDTVALIENGYFNSALGCVRISYLYPIFSPGS